MRISLDDFGTGYSSLSYLHSFPLNKVKIDRSFLQGVNTSQRPLKLLRSVARLSADLGMSVVVEGIETEEQLALVAQEPSVEEVQGFLIGAAMPSVEVRKMLVAPSERAQQGRLTQNPSRPPERLAGAADGRLMKSFSGRPAADQAIGALAVDDGLDLAAVDADIVQDAIVEAAQKRDGCELRAPRPIGLPPAPESSGRARARAGTAGRGCGNWMTWVPPWRVDG